MSTLIDIQSQIEKLQKQASEIRTKEFDATLIEITAKMKAFGISIKDIQRALASPKKGRIRSAGAKPKAAPAKKSGTAKPAPIKYRGPQGETWSGRGLMPKWLSALVAQGKTRDDFAV